MSMSEHRSPLLANDAESSSSGGGDRMKPPRKESFEISPKLRLSPSKENMSPTDSDVQIAVDVIPDGEHGGFEFSHEGLSSAEAKRRLLEFGPNSLPEVKISKWYIFCQQLWQPMPIMIWIAAIIEAALSNFDDMGVLLFIQFFNATLGYKEITSAGDAVAALKRSLQTRAEVFRDNRWMVISAVEVVPGDMVKLASGSAVPADCRVNEGQIDVDQSAMTGESLPVTMFKGDKCIMGSTVCRGETEGTVEFTGANTVYGKTAKMLENTAELSNLQKLLIKIVSILVVICFVLCVTVLGYLIDLTGSIQEAISYAVVLMVASIPMAIEIVTTTTLALGSSELAARGAIVTRLAAIEDMAGMAILCSDKTGTLTKNVMELQEETPIYEKGQTQYTLLRYAAMAAKWREDARDALDRLTLGSVDHKSLEAVVQTNYVPFDPVVKRTEGTVIENGITFKTTKGAPNVLLDLCLDASVGGDDRQVADKVNADVKALGEKGIRSLAVAKTDPRDGKWRMLGLLTFLDPPREDTAQTIREAIAFGVAVKMITGDHLLIAKEMAKRLNLGTFVLSAEGLPMLGDDKKKPENLSQNYGDLCLAADGFAQVFPEHKYLIVECLRELGYKVGMTGDGVNDAPALKRADVGVAVAGSTDAARSAADIVLTEPGLSTIVHGIFCARQIFKRISNFLTYRIAATLQLLVFFFIAVFAFRPINYMPAGWQTMPNFPDDFVWSPYYHMPGESSLIFLRREAFLSACSFTRSLAHPFPPPNSDHVDSHHPPERLQPHRHWVRSRDPATDAMCVEQVGLVFHIHRPGCGGLGLVAHSSPLFAQQLGPQGILFPNRTGRPLLRPGDDLDLPQGVH